MSVERFQDDELGKLSNAQILEKYENVERRLKQVQNHLDRTNDLYLSLCLRDEMKKRKIGGF